MRNYKLYNWEKLFDFGQHKGQSVKDVFEKSPSYISWCFQKVEWFCIPDEIFEKLPIVISLRTGKDEDDWLKKLTDLQSRKIELLESQSLQNDEIQNDNFHESYTDNRPYMKGDPRFDRDENPWIDVFGEGEEAEAAYWNTH